MLSVYQNVFYGQFFSSLITSKRRTFLSDCIYLVISIDQQRLRPVWKCLRWKCMHTRVFSIPHGRITRERKKTMTWALFKRAKLWDKHTRWSSVTIKRSRVICQRTVYQDWEDLFPFSRCCKARRDYRPQPATRILLPSWDKLRHTHCSENVELRHEFPVESKATRARYSRKKTRSFHVSINSRRIIL